MNINASICRTSMYCAVQHKGTSFTRYHCRATALSNHFNMVWIAASMLRTWTCACICCVWVCRVYMLNERERANAVRMKLLLVFSCVRANCTLCTPHKVIIDVVHSTTGFTHSHMHTMIYVLRGAHKEFVSQWLWVCAFLFSFLNILKVCIWAIHGHNHLSNISSC